MVSRRKYLVISGSLASGGLAGCIGSASAQSDVEMNSLNVDGDSVTLNDGPEEVNIDVSGEFEATANTTPEQIQITLQCHVGEDALVDDIGQATFFDTKAGTYEISADLLEHRDVTSSSLNPPIGETLEMPLLVRIICSVIVDGSIVAEDYVEDTAPLTVTAEGIEATIGGTGSVEIV